MNVFLSESLVWAVYNMMMPIMFTGFAFTVFARIVLYLTVKSEWRFTVEFEHRVESFLGADKGGVERKFQTVVKDLLSKTHYEYYLLKAQRRMRRMDYPITFLERIFGVAKASERIMDDTLKQTQYFKPHETPDFDRVSKYVFASNPYFNRFLGLIPKNIIDDLLNICPGLFIVCGLLGTFVGIVGGIPELGRMDVTDIESTSVMLNHFLTNMSFAMTTSILGMILSLIMTILNTALSPYSTYVDLIDIYKNSLAFIWNECHDETQAENKNTSRRIFKKNSARATDNRRSS